jgi:hypothetical protein
MSAESRHKYSSLLQNIDSLDTLLLSTNHEESAATHEEAHSSLFPSLVEHTLMSSADLPAPYNISERYQDALIALRAQAQSKNLALVYQRILRKIKKTEQHLDESLRAIESARDSVEIASAAVSLCISEKLASAGPDEPILAEVPALPVVTIHPHHLKWEAVDISIPPGGLITLPIPVPILPQSSPSSSQVSLLL